MVTPQSPRRSMKVFSLAWLLAGALISTSICGPIALAQTGDRPQLKVLTLNMRVDIVADSLNNWRYRRDAIGALIRTGGFDLVGSQEVLHNQLLDLLERLPGYGYLGVGRIDGQTAGEYSAIFYRKERFAIVQNGHFWLSETPDVPGSKNWDAACERIVTWGILKDQFSGLSFALFNTHFDHRGQIARRESARIIMTHIDQIAGDLPVILLGDFNGAPESEPIKIILAHGRLRDSRSLAGKVDGPSWSFHGFGKVPEPQRELLDFIFISPTSLSPSTTTFSRPSAPPIIQTIIPSG